MPAPVPDARPDSPTLLTALAGVVDPEIRRPITELDMVTHARLDDAGTASVSIALTIVGCPAATAIERDVRAAVLAAPGVLGLDLEVGVMSAERRRRLVDRLRNGRARTVQFTPDDLTRVYAITSGKGGVGKSTITANLAVALAARGLAVGLIDADVHGFSIPGLLGLTVDGETVKPTQVGEMILPPVAHGVKVISIGMFLEGSGGAAGAVSWRGPMLHRTIQQFLTDVYFGDLDVLLLDLPPGTGDVAISIGQLLPHAEVIVVTTPQPAAADVAERSGIVARQTGQRVYGVIENMAGLAQPDGTVLEIFGAGGGAEVARRLSAGQDAPVPLLASVPLSVALREGGDAGAPIVLAGAGAGDGSIAGPGAEARTDAAAAAILRVADSLATRSRGLAGRKLPLSLG